VVVHLGSSPEGFEPPASRSARLGPRPARPSCAPTAVSTPLPLTPAPPGLLRSGSVAGTGDAATQCGTAAPESPHQADKPPLRYDARARYGTPREAREKGARTRENRETHDQGAYTKSTILCVCVCVCLRHMLLSIMRFMWPRRTRGYRSRFRGRLICGVAYRRTALPLAHTSLGVARPCACVSRQGPLEGSSRRHPLQIPPPQSGGPANV
jgi:hypothetical protein